ncbi:aminoglycoside phosphotransferase family protein [Pseudomonas aeruginosa]|nr:aminoglycoside phosphotransferase family protein [Pseudomonas aeruginosa]
MNESLDFSPYLERWALQPDGRPSPPQRRLRPVRHRGAAAMLKDIQCRGRRFGHVLLATGGTARGAARVLAIRPQALP